MGCCGNKKECDTNKAEMKDLTTWIVTNLIDTVKTGKLPGLFKNPAADQLAVMIANVVDENKYLRALLSVMRPDVVVNDETFSISFGPGKQYSLTIPVTNESTRQELVAALQVAIEKLKHCAPPETAQQLPLFQYKN